MKKQHRVHVLSYELLRSTLSCALSSRELAMFFFFEDVSFNN